MIKPEELRIGNYIYEPINEQNDDTKPFKVWGIYHEEGNNKINGFPISYYNPISLTEQWLLDLGLKFSFENETGKFYTISLKLNGTFLLVSDSGDYWIGYDNGNGNGEDYISVGLGKLDTIHQLQNLYFSLTDEELEYKKK